MLLLLSIFLSSFVIAFSGALMPGPLLTATISESSQRGAIAGPLLILGHSILELLLLVALFLGLAPLLTHSIAFIIISIVGGSILLWMAIGMFRSLPTLELKFDTKRVNQGHLIKTGILMSLANPYWTIWWATIGLGLIMQSKERGLAGVACFYFGHILADLIWYAFVSTAVGKGKRLMNNQVYRGLIGSCAVILVGFSLYFIYAAIGKMLA